MKIKIYRNKSKFLSIRELRQLTEPIIKNNKNDNLYINIHILKYLPCAKEEGDTAHQHIEGLFRNNESPGILNPTIDVYIPKNQELSKGYIQAIFRTVAHEFSHYIQSKNNKYKRNSELRADNYMKKIVNKYSNHIEDFKQQLVLV